MSATRAITELRIRRLLDDLDPDAYAISSVRMHDLLDIEMQLLASRAVLSMEATVTITLVAGTYDYTISGILSNLRQAVLNSNGFPLTPLPLEELNATYFQGTAQAVGRSTPRYYALFETSAQASKMRVAPTPVAADTINLFYSVVPTALSDTTNIPFSAPLVRVLELSCATSALSMMSPEDRQQRMLGPEAAGRWAQMAEQGLRDENWRQRVASGALQHSIVEMED